MKNILIGASWKMNKTVSESIDYAKKLAKFVDDNLSYLKDIDLFVLPTFLALHPFSKLIGNPKLKYGAQNCFWEDEGAFTGEISPMHLKNIGCTYVELGHPERRNILKEDDSIINKKAIACLRNDLMPILCIGEERKYTDVNMAYKFLKSQLLSYLEGVTQNDIKKVIIAYEPVWAIGASKSASTDYIYHTIGYLRELLEKEFGVNVGKNQIIIYGGSINLENAEEILKIDNSNGVFAGRAGLSYDFFTKIVKIAINVKEGS